MRRTPRTAGLAALAAVALIAPTVAEAVPGSPTGTTFLVNAAPNAFGPLTTPAGEAQMTAEAISEDGRYVAFSSYSDGLATGDDDDTQNVYVKDRLTGAVTFASRATGADGAPGHEVSRSPSISDDGTRVAFESLAALDPADTNGTYDVYVRDIVSNQTWLVSRAGPAGAVGNGSSSDPDISGDGQSVAFSSGASNLSAADPNTRTDIYKAVVGGAVTLVSRSTGVSGAVGSGFSSDASISDDGSRIAFESQSTNLLAVADTNDRTDVYVRDTNASTTVVASVPHLASGTANPTSNGFSGNPSISGDGTRVAFESGSTNLGNGDTDTTGDVHLRNLETDSTRLVSKASGPAGAKSNGGGGSPSANDDGLTVAFTSTGTNLDPAATTGSRAAYLWRSGPSTTQLVSRFDGDAGASLNRFVDVVALSGTTTESSQVVVFEAQGANTPDVVDERQQQVFARTLASPQTTTLVSRPPGNDPFGNAGGDAEITNGNAVSGDGRYVVFVAEHRAYGQDREQVYRRDTLTGAVVLVSRADGPDGAAPADGDYDWATISEDGNRVAFISDEQLDATPLGGNDGVYVRDIALGRTILASRASGADGAVADGSLEEARISGDGNRVAFIAKAANLGDGSTDSFNQAFVRDLATQQTFLASRASGAGGAEATADVDEVDIDHDGSRVVVRTDGLASGDGDDHAYVRDLAAATTVRADTAADGTLGNRGVGDVDIDGSGDRVLFTSEATNLDPSFVPPNMVAWVKDLGTGAVRAVTRTPGGGPPAGFVSDPDLSSDGRTVGFSYRGTDLSPGVVGDIYLAYVVAADGGTPVLGSRLDGPDGAPFVKPLSDLSVSGNGACLVVDGATDRRTGVESDGESIFARAVGPECPTVAPETTITSIGTPAANARSYAFSSSEAGSTFRCSFDGAPEAPCVPGTTVTGGPGSHTFTVRAVDPAGVADPTPASSTFAVSGPTPPKDTTKPRISKLSVSKVVRGRKATIRLTLSERATVRVTVERKVGRSYRKVGSLKAVTLNRGARRITLPAKVAKRTLRVGAHRISVTATDAARNRSATARKAFTVRRR